LTQPAGLTANITAKAISITGNSIADKIYDGNATATIIGTAALSGVLPGDAASVILGGTPLATFANTSVETGKPVTISGYSISGSASGNYSLSQPGGLTANITAKSITITGINISNKQYDGNTTATISGTAALSGVLSGDAANVTLGDTPAATFATAGLGTAKSVTISGYSISGSASGNYSLTQPIGLTADITAKILTISAQPVSKVYDGNTTATLNFDTFDMASGLVGNEDVSLIYASATYDTKNVGTGKAITISGLALSGIDKDNYRLNTFSTNGEITTKSLTASVIGTVSKVYDGAVTATLASANYSLSGVLSGDAVVLNNPTSGSYDTRNIGTGKIVTVNGLSISGTNAANYSLGSTSISGAVGTITTKNLTASLTGIVSKIYDGTTVAGLNASNYILSGVVPGETVVLNNPTSGSYDNRNAGAGKTVTVNGLSISGIDGASYSLASTNINGTVGTITAKALTITADNKEKFLGTANPELTVRYDGFVTGEESNVLSTQPSIVTTADINSGLGDYPITASGAVAQNYNISYIGGILSIKPGAPTSVGLAAVTLYEHKPAGTLVGTLNSTSNDPNAVFTYSLVAGTGDADNVDFNIVNNELRTVTPLNYEAQQNYKIRVRSTTQYGFSLDQDFVIQLNDVNEAPTLNAIENQIICYNKDEQRINLSGITAGPDVNQTTTLSVLSNTNSLFQNLSIAGNQLRYTIANNQSGTAVVTLTVKDNGGTANGGVNEISRSFTITVNPLPVITITSDKGNSISRGESVVLTASGGVKYKWTTLGAIGGKETSQFLVRPLSTTTYVVTAETAGGCVAEASFKVEVKGDYQAIEAENFITPNGDGVNDTWVVKNIDAYPAHTLTIVDRAGRIVYKVRNYKNDWDGRLNASLLQEGTYYYLFRFDQPNVRVMKGFITIVR
ncbi:YDG domain-containing protein, partial [Pedobacter nyackensis]|uniref:YDG domain-containing protein n=1 Tax=Pedobacter nyackensis TaxID=475255 RepID=UPI002930C7B2